MATVGTACSDGGTSAELNRFIHFDPVRLVDGEPALVFASGSETVAMHGSAATNYFDGWRADFVYTGFAPILVIQLVHSGGDRVVWYASCDGDRLGDKVSDLSDHHRTLLRRAAMPILQRLLWVLTEAVEPRLSDFEHGFLQLGPACRQELLGLCQDGLVRQVEIVRVDDVPACCLVPAADGGPPVALRREHLRTGLRRVLQDQMAADVVRGTVSFTCPVTGAEIGCQGSLCFDDFHFAYRFADATGRFVFYVIAGHELSFFYALYVPALALLLPAPVFEGPAEGARHFLPLWLPRHLIHHGAEFEAYLRQRPRGISSPLRAPPWTHIGHQLWNELSGIERYLRDAGPGGRQPEWLVPDGERQIEFYGPIDVLFPQLVGRVRRGLRDAEDLVRYAYRTGRIVVRVTRNFVSAELRARLLEHARRHVRAAPGGDEPATDAPVLLLGLRLENRTLEDLGGFYERLAAAVLARHPGARFILDGHNVGAAGAGKYRSHGERSEQARDIERAEFAVLERLQQAFGAGTVRSAVGLTVPANLLLIARCEAFIAPWGAGLAKYRWACNKPGYVFTSRWNLQRRADLAIYHAAENMQDPAELRWIRAELVTDQAAPPKVAGSSMQPQWLNFSMDEARVIGEFIEFVDRRRSRDLAARAAC